VAPGDRVERVEIVEFREPPEYRAPAGWLRQFSGKRLDQDLSLRGSVAAITGATLTSRAVVRSLRRVLALHQVIAPFGQSLPR
jgi:Na+-translocating ferredoxin:NAD+ oxidoreductase RnfG subunit